VSEINHFHRPARFGDARDARWDPRGKTAGGTRARIDLDAGRHAADSILEMNRLGKNPPIRNEVVDQASAGQRLDNFLQRVCRGVPKSHLYRVLRTGEVRVNGRRADPGYRLRAGDQLRIPPLRLGIPSGPGSLPPPIEPFQAVFEDEGLLALAKPAGVAVHGGSGISHGVIEHLRAQRPDAPFLELVHRLDRDTSGLLVVAKKRAVLTALHGALREGQVQKTYVALVRGRWIGPDRRIGLALHKYTTADGERRVSVRPDGKPAVTRVRLMRRWENFSLLKVVLETGRTHQIRVHLAHIGFPVCGDDKYGDFGLNRVLRSVGLRRMFLHAAALSFRNPASGELLALEAPLPDDLEGFLAALDANERRDHAAAL
jgi:23S rRNA pseudouridine955/2504/2580 synthase